MSHDYDGAVWADNHQHLSTAIAHLLEALATAFECLVAIEYDAPWERA
jgi:hypothetical protein